MSIGRGGDLVAELVKLNKCISWILGQNASAIYIYINAITRCED